MIRININIDNIRTNETDYLKLIHLSNVEHHNGDNKSALEYAYLAYKLAISKSEINIKERIEVSIFFCIRMQDYDLRTYWNVIKKILLEMLELCYQNEDLVFNKATVLYLLADYTYLKREFEDYHKFYGQLIDLLNIKFNKISHEPVISELYGKAFLSRSMYLLSNDSFLSLFYLKQALIRSKHNNNQFLRMRLYIQLGRYYWYKKNQKSLVIFNLIIEKLNNENFIKNKYNQWDDLMLEVLFTMSSCQLYFSHYERALESCNEALKIARNIKSVEMEGESLVLLCKIHSKMSISKHRLVIFDEAFDFCTKNNYLDLLDDLEILKKVVIKNA